MQNPGEPVYWTLRQASENLRARKISSEELTKACLARIETFNPKIDAWITVMRDQALAQAKALDREASAGRWRGPLHGIPIGLKDNIDAEGVRTTAGSKTLAGNIARNDADVTRRLREAGAVFVGKCNMHIFASGATSAVSYYGPVRNPWNLEMIAGGSSGGSAAAVAMDHCYAALGTDTGGSIRTPSAMCGVTGFKATYGRVSIRGIVPLTWSLDHCGPIARTVEDTATVLQAIAGYDRLDLQSVDCAVPDYKAAVGAPVSRFRLGISPQFYDGLEPEVASALEAATAVLVKMTKGTKEVELPSILGTGANSEGGVYREELGNGFVRAETDSAGGGGGGPADYADDSRSGVEYRRGTHASGECACAQSEAGEYALAGRLRSADDYRAVRIFEERHADRAADQRGELARAGCDRAGARVPDGDGLAHQASDIGGGR